MYCSVVKREGMVRVTPVMHFTGGRHGLTDKTGSCGHQIPCFFSRRRHSSPILPQKACVLQFSTNLASPSLTRQRRPAPSASSLLHFSSPSPAPSPAARAQKQSRTQEAPDSAATRCRCRLLEASKSPTPSQASHTYPPG